MAIHIAVAGSGFGDEGKGVTVAACVKHFNANLVIRYTGGANAGHTVVAKQGTHTFNQIGSGTFHGAKTYLAPQFRVSPHAFIMEALHLKQLGLDLHKQVTVHEDCLVTTPYHILISQIMAEKHKRGTTGNGVGVTARYAEEFPDKALRVKDLLSDVTLKEKIEFLFEYTSSIIDQEVRFNYDSIKSEFDRFIRYVYVDDGTRLYSLQHLPRAIIYEGSQGFGLDVKHGTIPFVTSSDVTYSLFDELTNGLNYSNGIYKIQCSRIYTTRHGTGEFKTEQQFLHRLPEHHNKVHEYQGVFRRGWLDLDLLISAVKTTNPTHLSLGHLDYWSLLPEWKIFHNGDYVNFTVLDDFINYIKQAINVPVSILGFGQRAEQREFVNF